MTRIESRKEQVSLRKVSILVTALLAASCASAQAGKRVHGEAPHAERPVEPAAEDVDRELRAIAAIHGGAGPWVVAGYRMGRYALGKLGLTRGSFDLEVVHHTPRKVQFSCIADGAAAATGASLGKLNLSLLDAEEPELTTTYVRRSTGQTVSLRPSATFRARFLDVPRERLGAAGKEVLALPDAQVFEEVPAAQP